MIGVVARDTLRAVQLFGHDKPNKLMGINQGRKRPHEICPFKHVVGNSIGATDNTDDTATTCLQGFKMASEGRGVKHTTLFVKKNDGIARTQTLEYAPRLVLASLEAFVG
jgi:hypothetical protein